jgi:hypothetical protein
MFLRSFILGLAVLTLLVASASVTLGQLARPAAEYDSLLNMRFSEGNGEFFVEGLQIVFPPGGNEPAMLIVSRASGEVVVILPLRFESHSGSNIFGHLVPISKPGEVKLGRSGDFVLTIKVGVREITRLPFTLTVEPADDPYGPSKRFLREGPWRDLAYFSVPIGNPSAHVDFNWWMSLRELPIGMTNPLVTIHLIRGSREIARSPDSVALSTIDWQPFASELIRTTKSGPEYLTLGELVKRDGNYLLIVEANGKPIKSYPIAVEGGRLQRADQSRLDFEPHVDFISPRLIDTSARTDSHDLMRDVYWVRRSAVIGTFAQHWDSQ